jgi:hypothetical protein
MRAVWYDRRGAADGDGFGPLSRDRLFARDRCHDHTQRALKNTGWMTGGRRRRHLIQCPL